MFSGLSGIGSGSGRGGRPRFFVRVSPIALPPYGLILLSDMQPSSATGRSVSARAASIAAPRVG